MSNFWNWYIIVLTFANIAGIVWLLFANSRKRADDKAVADTTGQVWDEDLT
ncbi:MAG: cytochrome C oxidase Cbb3, partial [Proteobacteria bacterium]|nr:cytochrome C oxidase Cbb3 [Pseudomonadota bacterium]